METQNENNMQEWLAEHERSRRRGKFFGGIFVITIGALLLARQMGALIPEWVFTWKVLLIGFGLLLGVKNSFRRGGWMVPILVGLLFLSNDICPEISIRAYVWPIFFILLGLFIMFKPKRRYCGPPYDRWKHKYSKHWEQWQEAKEVNPDSESQLEIVTVFGSVKKTMIYKDFKGGEIVSVFGGTELNLTQSDIDGTIVIDAVQVFGGTKLIIPPNWQVKSEIACVLGGVEDKRPLVPDNNANNNKVLILRGTCCFGGLEITSS